MSGDRYSSAIYVRRFSPTGWQQIQRPSLAMHFIEALDLHIRSYMTQLAGESDAFASLAEVKWCYRLWPCQLTILVSSEATTSPLAAKQLAKLVSSTRMSEVTSRFIEERLHGVKPVGGKIAVKPDIASAA
jgi:hypothetical protein